MLLVAIWNETIGCLMKKIDVLIMKTIAGLIIMFFNCHRHIWYSSLAHISGEFGIDQIMQTEIIWSKPGAFVAPSGLGHVGGSLHCLAGKASSFPCQHGASSNCFKGSCSLTLPRKIPLGLICVLKIWMPILAKNWNRETSKSSPTSCFDLDRADMIVGQQSPVMIWNC